MAHNIGNQIKELRKKRNLTQAELANIIGCSQSAVAGWEKRKNRIPTSFLIDLVRILGVSVETILNGKTDAEGIPCYGHVKKNFTMKKIEYLLELHESECKKNRFALLAKNSLLEPLAEKGDYCIFDRDEQEKDNDIVIITDSSKEVYNIMLLRKDEKNAVFSSPNLLDTEQPIFATEKNSQKYKVQKIQKNILVVAVLIAIKKTPKINKKNTRIKYLL